MTSSIVPVPPRGSALLAALAAVPEAPEAARKYIAASRAANSMRAYKSDWAHFDAWCYRHGLPSVPAAPTTLTEYITALADGTAPPSPPRADGRNVPGPKDGRWKASTIDRKCHSIAFVHRKLLQEDPTRHDMVRSTLEGIRRRLGMKPEKKKPLLPSAFRVVFCDPPADLRATMIKAVILVGFGAAMRRSEVVQLHVEDVEFKSEGLRITLRSRKNDQRGEGTTIAVVLADDPNLCPSHALRAWLDASGINSGPLFRTVAHGRVGKKQIPGDAVRRYVKEIAGEVFGEEEAEEYSGHSLRAGWATAAAENGARLEDIMGQTGHKTPQVARGYIRKADEFKQNPGKGLL